MGATGEGRAAAAWCAGFRVRRRAARAKTTRSEQYVLLVLRCESLTARVAFLLPLPPHALAVSKANAKPSSGKTAQSARKSAYLFRLSDAGAPARPLNHSLVIRRRQSARVMRALRGSTLMAPARKYLILLDVGRLARAAPGCGPVRHRRCHQRKSNIP